MLILRMLVVAFNAAVITYLVYRLLKIYQDEQMPRPRKTFVLVIGILLLVLPCVIVIGFVRPTMHYFLLYPIAVSFFLYLVRNSERGRIK